MTTVTPTIDPKARAITELHAPMHQKSDQSEAPITDLLEAHWGVNTAALFWEKYPLLILEFVHIKGGIKYFISASYFSDIFLIRNRVGSCLWKVIRVTKQQTLA